MAIAKTDTLCCTRCGGKIRKGDTFRWYNRPRPQSPFHVTCPAMEGAQEEQEAASATVESKAPEAAPEAATVESKAPAHGAGDLATLLTALTSMVDSRVLALLGQKAATDGATMDMVNAAVQAALAPRTLTVEVKRVDGTTHKVDNAHYLFPRLLALLGAGFHVYLWGPAGTGKTTAALAAAKALGLACEIDTLDRSTPKSGVLGYRTPTGEPVETAFTRMYATGGVYVADECDNAPASVQTLFNSALANGHAPAAWGLVDRHATFGFVGTGNTPGRPTPAFPDRQPMSSAFSDRLYFLYWPLDPNIERRATGRASVKAPERSTDTCSPADWGRWVEEIRAYSVKHWPTLMVTPRATIEGVKALALGECPADVAAGLVFRGADPVTVDKALAACPLPSTR